MNDIKLAKGIYWVGAVDHDIPPSSGYAGTSYNAYLIVDEKVTLVDGVKYSHRDQFWNRIRNIIDPVKIDYMIVNHVEPDHSSSLPEIISTIKPEKIFCSAAGKDAIIAHFHDESWPFEVVKSGDEISLGARTIHFIMTRMLHWPDSMFSYLKKDGILFSNDAFGQHIASDERFDDEVDIAIPLKGAKFFYANNLNLLSPLIKKTLRALEAMNLGIRMIAPDHGYIWRSHPEKILEAYAEWSCQKHSKEVLIVYDTKWKSTELMANAIAQGIEEKNVPVKICSLKTWHRGAIMEEFLTASTIVMGSPTINNGVIPSMAAFLHYIKGLKPKNKLGAGFGSYGWGGEGVRQINSTLDDLKIKRVDDGLRIKFVPDEAQLQACVEYGHKIAEATLAFNPGCAKD
ncbi:FprA family A-type flavoprotein [Halodesulfovibrio marinisediminis]|uniref:Flavorubredoxin n=1 Tax=Halodesulfovibrio marinisediminis DSM 17456 TaxID=1121457 RepID=A0A1N6J6C4_9BACT|nr:FprA family A-type flavoprotein [Halodesulfovibrio marinisediminis]SIO39884.1 Flavorubredoxin [Halodesulfovibrio marinisediminis DSM 17456]